MLNRRVSPSCADSSGACSKCSTGKREMIKGSKSPGQMKRIEEKKNSKWKFGYGQRMVVKGIGGGWHGQERRHGVVALAL